MGSWGDVDEKEDNERTRTVEEKTGIITESYIRTDENGKRFRVTKKYKETQKSVRVNKNVEARKKWAKFGDCKGLPPGPEMNITYQTVDPIDLDLIAKKEVEPDTGSLTASSTTCRRCGESGHWTIQCPTMSGESKQDKEERVERRPRVGTSGFGGGAGKWVPPSRNNGTRDYSSNQYGQSEEQTGVRVTNLPEETVEQDLRDLFQRFGRITRCFMAKDKNTGLCRGFAFINFQTRQQAQEAINRLHRYGYAGLILHVEWAKPRDPATTHTGASDRDRAHAIQNSQRRDRKSVV